MKLAMPRLETFRGRAAAVVLLALAVWLAGRPFSISCRRGESCLTIADLARGAPLPEAMHLFDRFGAPLANVAGPLRVTLPEDRIPPRLAASFVAVEDRRFWSHDGVDYRGVARALVEDLASGHVVEGASTIPMQVVRTVWASRLATMNRWRRKIIEARTAPRLVSRLGRRRVLTLYLNSIYLGNGIYGVEAASRYYFGVPADSLDLAQTATLVGMTRAPEFYDPRHHPGHARARRNTVLGVLASAGVATPQEARRAREQPLETAPEPEISRERSYLTAAVTREVREVAPDLAGRPGLRVFTSIDPRIQAAGDQALERQLARVERRSRHRGHDVLQGGAVALDPFTGAVRAWIGGRDFHDSQYDHVSQAHRQVGSLLKPFIVVAALEHGRGILDPVSTLPDSLRSGGEEWAPADHVTTPVLPLREALIHSSNRAAVNLGLYVGLDAVRDVARSAGIESPIPKYPSSLIGAFDASLLEMTSAYAAFDNGGIRVTPHLIQRIQDDRGDVLWRRADAGMPEHVMDPATSFVVLDALRGVVDRGTAWPVRASGYDGPAAGKTGTTNGGRDAWFIGMVPDLVAGVWVGYDHPRRIMPGASGGDVAGPAWAFWMKGVDAELGASRGMWSPPDGVEDVVYNRTTGEVYRAGCSSSVADAESAWVRTGQYNVSPCPGTFRAWILKLWHAVAPPQRAPVVGPVPGERGGG